MIENYDDLIRVYGAKNVEDTCIYITQSTDPKGLAVSIPPTKDRVEAVLEAVHGEFLLEWLKKYA